MMQEIAQQRKQVALRKESVDRNFTMRTRTPIGCGSLSARRAWIEIGLFGADTVSHQVALRKESVDRNVRFTASLILPLCRSPQGERG